jgi:ABC-2 type transport system permease protein
MSKTLVIWKKEARGYATSPMLYVLFSLVFFGTSFIFWISTLREGQDASIRGIMGWFAFFLLAVTPILTMRLVAEESTRGTLELLLTSPVREWDVVLGKFLGTLTAFVALFAISLIYPLILLRISDPETGPMLSQYIGIILCSGAFISVGMFASSITQSQVIAAVVGYVLLLTFWICGFFADLVGAKAAAVLKAVSLIPHLDNFGKGIIDAVDVFYYLAFTAVFLFLTWRSIEARRWA